MWLKFSLCGFRKDQVIFSFSDHRLLVETSCGCFSAIYGLHNLYSITSMLTAHPLKCLNCSGAIRKFSDFYNILHRANHRRQMGEEVHRLRPESLQTQPVAIHQLADETSSG